MAQASEVGSLDWSSILKLLPLDLDRLARDTGAVERFRKIKSGEDLVRCGLLWASPRGAINRAAIEAGQLNVASLSGTALFKRFAKSEAFISSIVGHVLGRFVRPVDTWKGFRIVAVDATVLCGPAPKGTDQRLHVGYDLSVCKPVHIDLTGPEGGETFRRFTHLGAGRLVLGDQCYGRGPGILPLLESKASVLVRFNFHSIRLLGMDGAKITPEMAEGRLPETGTVEFEAILPDWPTPVRIFGARNPEGKGIWLLSDLNAAQLDASEVRDLYAKRWQIELFFKRLKSILDLDKLPSNDGPTARVWIWLKMLFAALAMVLESSAASGPKEKPAPTAEAEKPKPSRAVKKKASPAKSPNRGLGRASGTKFRAERESS